MVIKGQEDPNTFGLLPVISYDFREMGQSATVFFDEGSTVSLITKKLADELFLDGTPKLTSIFTAYEQSAQAVLWIYHDLSLQDQFGTNIR